MILHDCSAPQTVQALSNALKPQNGSPWSNRLCYININSSAQETFFVVRSLLNVGWQVHGSLAQVASASIDGQKTPNSNRALSKHEKLEALDPLTNINQMAKTQTRSNNINQHPLVWSCLRLFKYCMSMYTHTVCAPPQRCELTLRMSSLELRARQRRVRNVLNSINNTLHKKQHKTTSPKK
jgi:hypothetical protein